MFDKYFCNSFLAYKLGEADLLVYMSVLGGRIKVEIHEFEKPSRAHMPALPTSSKKSQNGKSATNNNDGIKT